VLFTRTKHGADRLTDKLNSMGVNAAVIHGGRSQAQRDKSLSDFHRGKVAALVATDVAARGIHVDQVACVVHVDLPDSPTDYQHRSGRTARAGATGTVVSLVTPDQRRHARNVQKAFGFPGQSNAPDMGLIEAGEVPVMTEMSPAQRRAEESRPRRDDSARRDDRPRRDSRGHSDRSSSHGARAGSRSDRPGARSERGSRSARPAGSSSGTRRSSSR
jgi:superfamily II DNA/RNA helicase